MRRPRNSSRPRGVGGTCTVPDMADKDAPPIDTTRPPTGELAARRLVEALVRTDDRAERHYLEVKSDIDSRGR